MSVTYESTQKQLGMYITEIRETNYFNPRHGIIRVRNPFKDDIFYDFKLAPTFYPPSPKYHRALLITAYDQLTTVGLSKERLELPPGLEDDIGTLADISMGIVYLVDRNQRLYTSDNQTGSVGFSISDTNMYEEDKVRVALTPSISRDYTSSDGKDDSNEVGLFINDNTVALRANGGQITVGKEGIHFGGNIHWESTTHSKEFMQDNFIHQLIPSTIPTAAISIPQLPNFGMIAQLAATANKVIFVFDKAGQIIDLVS